jgi:NHL repeat
MPQPPRHPAGFLRVLLPLMLLGAGHLPGQSFPYATTTFAGLAGNSGSRDGTGREARFASPQAVAADAAGNVYVSDTGNNTIRKITPAGVVTTLAGLAGTRGVDNGPGLSARFDSPRDIEVDPAGNVYVLDDFRKIRKLAPNPDGTVTVSTINFTRRRNTAFALYALDAIAVDGAGNLYVVEDDDRGETLSRISFGTGGTIQSTRLLDVNLATQGDFFTTLAADAAGNLYTTRGKMTFQPDGTVSFPAASSFLGECVAVDASGNIFGRRGFGIGKFTPAGVATLVAGSQTVDGTADGTGGTARFKLPSGVAVDGYGNVFVADRFAHTIRKVSDLSILIDDISTSEPLFANKIVNFTVRLNHASPVDTSVDFATRSGTANSNSSLITARDFTAKSGRLTIPANTLTAQVPVTLLADSLQLVEPDETFFLDLSNAVGALIGDSIGQCTIRDTTLQFNIGTFNTGGFDLTPDNAAPAPGDTVLYSIVWTVPEGAVWRDLRTIDFRIRDKKKTALWLRWDETTDLFTLLNTPKNGKKGDEEVVNAIRSHGIVVGDLPGSNVVLEGARAELDLAESSVVGSGPTGKTVTLNLAVRFLDKAEGRSFELELAATDDFLNEDEFIQAGKVEVKRIVPSGPK